MIHIYFTVRCRMQCETLEPHVKRHNLAAAISATLKTTTYQFTDVNLSHLRHNVVQTVIEIVS